MDDDGDSVTFMFQSPSEWQSLSFSMYYSRVCFFLLAAEKVRHNGILLFCFLLWFVYNTVCLHIASGEGEYFLHKEGLVCVVIDAYNLESLFC